MSVRIISALVAVTALSAFGQAGSYKYDSVGHLVLADFGAGGVITYTYDAAGHLVSRTKAANRCDVNGDGQVNAVDVQAIVNMALGVTSSTVAADFDEDGVINVVDVQTLINVVAGIATCPT
jgi:YD repeat-containing protein